MMTKKKRKNEIKGVIYLTLSLFILISLISYHPQDPSFTTSGDSTVSNLMGIAGAYLSDGFLTLFGASSYLLPLYLMIPGWRKLRAVSEEGEPFLNKWSSIGTVGLIFSLPASLSLLIPQWPSVSGEWILYDETGGLLGRIETTLFIRYFGYLGNYLISFSLLLLSIMFLTHFSPWTAATNFLNKCSGFLDAVRKGLSFSLKTTKKMKENAREAGKKIMPKSRPKIIEPPPPLDEEKEDFKQEPLPFLPAKGDYQLPPLTLLDETPSLQEKMSKEELELNAQLLGKKLLDFGIEGNVSAVHPGPVITLYEFEPAPGIKVNKITNLSDDLALAMKAMSVRIVAPIPGKSAVGIEIPNRVRETVSLRHLIAPNGSSSFRLPLYLGKDISGQPVMADFTEMPHLLVAGATGSGKSVALNAMVLSLLFSKRPGELKMMMIDPKMLELTTYNDIPHLIKPVITQPREAAKGLQEVVLEMQRRYRFLAESGVRNIEGYQKLKPHQKIKPERSDQPEESLPKTMPYLVIIIDELADLMMTSQREVEDSIGRLAQMGRAAGIHLLLATQRPSVDVLTGVIKANFPARISFQVSSKTDSRTILDANGAEQLLGKGDMLFLAPGTGKITRIHGPYVSEEEIKKIVSFIKTQEKPNYEEFKLPPAPDHDKMRENEERDELYEKATELVVTTGQASASFIQRRLRVGYPRAARMLEMMEEDGIVGPVTGGKQREVLIKKNPDE